MKKYIPRSRAKKNKTFFESYLATLTLFIKENGQFPTRLQDIKLYNWVVLQILKYHKGILSNERFNQLDLLGLDWNKKENEWQAKLNNLESYLINNKRLPPLNHESKLISWFKLQRRKLKKGRLSASQQIKVEEFEMFLKEILVPEITRKKNELTEKEKDFQDTLALLIAFRVDHPNSWPEHKLVAAEEIKLSKWCRLQRKKFRKNELSTQRIEQLKSIGFHFVNNTEYWMTCYDDLITHLSKEYSIPPKSNHLHKWCKSQYKLFDYLSNDKQDLLIKIGFKELF